MSKTTYTFKFTCGSKKNIERTVSAEGIFEFIDKLVYANLEKEALGTASAFIVDVLRNVEGKEPVSVKWSVFAAYKKAMTDARNVLRENLLTCEGNPVFKDGKLIAYYSVVEVEGEPYMLVFYPNGLLKSDKAFKDMDALELSLVS